jgi:hypothetical protein
VAKKSIAHCLTKHHSTSHQSPSNSALGGHSQQQPDLADIALAIQSNRNSLDIEKGQALANLDKLLI